MAIGVETSWNQTVKEVGCLMSVDRFGGGGNRSKTSIVQVDKHYGVCIPTIQKGQNLDLVYKHRKL